MRRFSPILRTGALLVILSLESVFAIPFNDSFHLAADLGSSARIHRQSDPRAATQEEFEAVLAVGDTSEPIQSRTGSLWFKWTAPSNGTYHVAALDFGDFLDVYRDNNGKAGALIGLDLGPYITSFSATAGERIYIRHTGYLFPFSENLEPQGFLLRREETGGTRTTLGSRRCIAGYIASFGAGNTETYQWSVPVGGSYRITIQGSSADPYEVELRRNGVAIPGFVTDEVLQIDLAAGDVLELEVSGYSGFTSFVFAPEDPGTSDLGGVTDLVVPSVPQNDFAWTWTAPSDGYVRLDLETIQSSSGLFFGEQSGFDGELVEISRKDGQCTLALGYQTGFARRVEAGVTYEFFEQAPSGELSGCIALSFFSTPTTIGQRIDAATVNLSLGTDAGLAEADAQLAAALAMDSAHPVANTLRAITRLVLLERDPAYASFLQSLGITGQGAGIFDSRYDVTRDSTGGAVFPADANATERVAALRDLFTPRISEIKGYLGAARAGGERRTYLADIGAFVIDEADALAISATMDIIQSLFDLLAVYDLGGSLNAFAELDNTGQLDLEKALAEFPNLLKVADSTAISKFKASVTNANTQLCAALVISAGERTVCGRHLFPPVGSAADGEGFLEFLEGLDEIAGALLGPVVIGNETIDLSKWNATSASLRSLFPEVRGGQAIGFTGSDPTLDGIFPERTPLDNPLEQTLGLADPAGFSQYIQQFAGSGVPPYLAGFNDDADGDGETNGKEYFFGADPSDSSVRSKEPVASLQMTSSGKKFRLSFVRRIGNDDSRYLAAVSQDLSTWDYSEADVTVVGSPVPVGDGRGEIVTVEIGSDLSGSKFVRIHAAAK